MADTVMTEVPFDQCTLQNCPLSRALYQYIPSLGANAFFLVYFGLCCIMSILALIFLKPRSWFFTIAMICGCVCEILGYTGRLLSHENPFRLTPFLIQICCLTMGPAYFSAAVYYSLSELIKVVGPQYSRLRPFYYTIIFCSCNLISLSLQGAGGGLASVASEKLQDPYVGDDIMLSGLASQVFSLTIFIALSFEYFWRATNHGCNPFRAGWPFLGTILSIAFATLFILIRSVYRVVELSEGWNGYLIGVESYFIVLEGLMITLSSITLCLAHPAFWGAWKDDVKGCSVIDPVTEMSEA